MADPVLILELTAKRMYRNWRAKQKRHRGRGGVFAIDLQPWGELPNWSREQWRGKALAALRSEESVLDELKREDRERRHTLAMRAEDANG